MKLGVILSGGIQRRLIASFLALSLVPTLAVGISFYQKASELLQKQTVAQMQTLSKKAIEQIEALLSIYKIQTDSLLLPLANVFS